MVRSPRAVKGSKQIGQSLSDTGPSPSLDGPSFLTSPLALPRVRFGITDVVQEGKRVVPACIDTEGRKSFLAIAKRAQCENVNLYTVLVIGAHMYISSKKLKCE
jgi:hypothetical protein